MAFLFTPEASLAGLFIASFLAATLLPGGSEAVFLAVVLGHPEQSVWALALATLGNTLGGMTTYALGRWLPQKVGADKTARAVVWLRRQGSPLLVFAWAPLIGDLLCAAAGWLRLHWLSSMLWMALGKGARYAALLWGIDTIG
ncbi:YqaA family protein [Sulfuricystis multivorans]|uniref:YqaA family protein n=1 Tax=Sulfuricystis multivorans TaxID=2211108 RepID=UPI000F83E8AA|nr:YqaA family protein [Sulfuricystis multivorans]